MEMETLPPASSRLVFGQFDETARLRAQGAVLRAIAAALLAGTCSPEAKSKQEYQYPSARSDDAMWGQLVWSLMDRQKKYC